VDDTSDPNSNYKSFCTATDRQRKNIGHTPSLSIWVMHDVAEDAYHEIVFMSWCAKGLTSTSICQLLLW
jgi:hypothetical protein